jgi:ADP-ribose pyrophosphatase YjhB (NUDIX family)
VTGSRVMLSFVVGDTRFNYRVAGVVIRDGHVLVCREDDDAYCMLPGGRVEMGEASPVALVREMAEEMVMAVTTGPLLFTSESFYGREGDRYHELGFIYVMDLPETVRPEGAQPFLVREDEGHLLQFSWLKLEGPALEEANLLPPWLPGKLRALSGVPEHVIFDEAASAGFQQ